MADIKGKCDDAFTGVRDVLAKNLDSGADVGSSAAVFIDGEAVVDLWGGFADAEKTKHWESDTIVNTFSTTKTMTALSMLILADRGVIDLDAPVKKYWPEFGANGKDKVLVKHFLGHTSGCPGWTAPVTVEDIEDHQKSTTLLARQAPWWEPGTLAGYHSMTLGPLNSEVIRRTTGMQLNEFFEKEIASVIGADYHIGVGPQLDHRVSNLIQSTPIRPRAGAETITDRVFFNPYITPQTSGTIGWRRADLGGSNGHGNARSVAKVQNVIACGGTSGSKRLLSEQGVSRLFEPQYEGQDQVLQFNLRWGMGFAIGGELVHALYGNRLDGHRICCWGGSGGSFVINDLDQRMTVAFVMNKHVEGIADSRSVEVTNAAFDALTVASR